MSHRVQPRYSLTQKTRRHVSILFPGQEREIEELLMFQCGNNLPFLEDADAIQLERVRFAVLKLSEGRRDALTSAIDLAKADWRDLLMAADFSEDAGAHEKWNPERK